MFVGIHFHSLLEKTCAFNFRRVFKTSSPSRESDICDYHFNLMSTVLTHLAVTNVCVFHYSWRWENQKQDLCWNHRKISLLQTIEWNSSDWLLMWVGLMVVLYISIESMKTVSYTYTSVVNMSSEKLFSEVCYKRLHISTALQENIVGWQQRASDRLACAFAQSDLQNRCGDWSKFANLIESVFPRYSLYMADPWRASYVPLLKGSEFT